MSAIDYEGIFENAEVGIALNDPETGTVGRVNERYASMVGYDREELRDMPIDEISADDPSFDQEAAMEKIDRALAGDRQQFDWLFERGDGSRFWGEVVLKRTMIGPEERLLAFVRDISDRKQYEQRLERTNRRLDEFASIVSHDLRNPLNVATLRLDMALEQCDNENLETVDRALTRMETLIDDMLSLARAGESIEETEAVDLPSLSRACWRTVERDDAELAVDADGTIEADESRVRQLLENVLRNAVQHGGDDVTITVGDLDDGFYVEDDGSGINPDERAKVLEPGYTTVEDGTGFGLGIVRDVATAHGWEIDVTESAAGGARFEFVDRQNE